MRPADLGDECPLYTLHGECKFGVTCRFGLCHLSAPGGVNQRNPAVTPPPPEINVFSWELSARLRKRLNRRR